MQEGTILIDPARSGIGIILMLEAYKIPFIKVKTDEVRVIQANRLREKHGVEQRLPH